LAFGSALALAFDGAALAFGDIAKTTENIKSVFMTSMPL
jgi:hypothetical protein